MTQESATNRPDFEASIEDVYRELRRQNAEWADTKTDLEAMPEVEITLSSTDSPEPETATATATETPAPPISYGLRA